MRHMTTFEHAMLGGSLALALGCHKRQGWSLVATAAVAGAVPDWDGLSIAFGGSAYASIHRIWGHNLLMASVAGAVVGALGYWIRASGRMQRTLAAEPSSVALDLSAQRQAGFLFEWLPVSVLAALIHLPADVVYSGHPEMTSWPLKLLWPFSGQGWVWPLVPWGDVGATLLFVAEMFAIYRWPRRAQSLACLTLLAVLSYIGVRGLSYASHGSN
jgi:membrane-bound metal-dependent hydrolase YbcI (DUF457 family)